MEKERLEYALDCLIYHMIDVDLLDEAENLLTHPNGQAARKFVEQLTPEQRRDQLLAVRRAKLRKQQAG